MTIFTLDTRLAPDDCFNTRIRIREIVFFLPDYPYPIPDVGYPTLCSPLDKGKKPTHSRLRQEFPCPKSKAPAPISASLRLRLRGGRQQRRRLRRCCPATSPRTRPSTSTTSTRRSRKKVPLSSASTHRHFTRPSG
jgi:hypothetical protein